MWLYRKDQELMVGLATSTASRAFSQNAVDHHTHLGFTFVSAGGGHVIVVNINSVTIPANSIFIANVRHWWKKTRIFEENAPWAALPPSGLRRPHLVLILLIKFPTMRAVDSSRHLAKTRHTLIKFYAPLRSNNKSFLFSSNFVHRHGQSLWIGFDKHCARCAYHYPGHSGTWDIPFR